jgi:hypothetical protein
LKFHPINNLGSISFHLLLAESTAHGLAKIATSVKTKRKVMWALLVIVGFTAATLQLSLLVKKYLQFSVVEVSEMKFFTILRWSLM